MDPELDIEEVPVDPLAGGLSSADALSAYRSQQSLVDKQMRANMAALLQGRDRLREQRTGPSASERLFAISAALGRPTSTGTLGETMGNLSTVLGAQDKAAREEAYEKAVLLEKYGAQIGGDQLQLLTQGQTAAAQMYRSALAAEGAKVRAGRMRTAISPVDGRIYNLDTGEIVAPSSAGPEARGTEELPVLSPEHVAALRRAGARLRFRTLDGREMEI